MLQEHCLYKSNLHYFSKISDHIGYVGSSAMDESFLLYGRPYGGCAIIWNNKMKYKVTQVDCTSKRLCGINIAIDEGVSFVVLNVYMPCDERQRGRNLDEFTALAKLLGHFADLLCFILILWPYNSKINFIFCKILTALCTYVMVILIFWISPCLKINFFLTYTMHPEECCCHGYKFIYLM